MSDEVDALEAKLVRAYLRRRAFIAALAIWFGACAFVAGVVLTVGAFTHPIGR
jgi:hypothetical protein